MAIDYTKIGWDTSKYVNPTNMNQMDNGIKAACDGVDAINAANYFPKTGGNITGYVKISHNAAVNEVLYLNNTNTSVDSTYMAFERGGTNIGYIGVKASTNKPVFKVVGGADHEIALLSAEQQLVVSSSSPQTVAFSTLTHNTYLVVASYATGGVVYVGVFARSENNSPGLADLITNPAIAVSTNATGITFTVGSGWGSSLVRLIALA